MIIQTCLNAFVTAKKTNKGAADHSLINFTELIQTHVNLLISHAIILQFAQFDWTQLILTILYCSPWIGWWERFLGLYTVKNKTKKKNSWANLKSLRQPASADFLSFLNF